jgi:hypothetical protein
MCNDLISTWIKVKPEFFFEIFSIKKPRTWTDSLDKRPRRKKMDMRFGTWNVSSMYRAGSLRAVVEEISKYNLDLVGVREVRWDGGGTEPERIYIFLRKRE